MDERILGFDPVPLRSRRDGWTIERQSAFIRFLRRGLKPGPAARRVGMRRQGAYELRERSGSESFCAAWDAAAAESARNRSASRSGRGLYARAVEGFEVPIRHRRRIVAVERRFDNAALIRLLRIADKIGRNPENCEGELFSLMDAELLSAFAPTTTLDMAMGTGRSTIDGGGSAVQGLEDEASFEPTESEWANGSSSRPIMPRSR